MERIDPTTLYEAEELRSRLKGFVSLETLREWGLAGSPGRGYWGQNVIDALDRYWHNLVRQRGAGKVRKEDHLDPKDHPLFEKREALLESGEFHPSFRGTKPLESERTRFRRQLSARKIPGRK